MEGSISRSGLFLAGICCCARGRQVRFLSICVFILRLRSSSNGGLGLLSSVGMCCLCLAVSSRLGSLASLSTVSTSFATGIEGLLTSLFVSELGSPILLVTLFLLWEN